MLWLWIHRQLIFAVEGVRTSTGRFCLIPLWPIGGHTLDGDGALLQRVAGVAGELHHGTHGEGRVTAAEVAVLDEGLVTVLLGKGWGAIVSQQEV